MARRSGYAIVTLATLAAAGALWRPLLGEPLIRSVLGMPAGHHDPQPCTVDRRCPSVTFAGQELADVLDFLRDVSGAVIYVDWRTLQAAGVKKDAPVAVKLDGMKWRSALDAVLRST